MIRHSLLARVACVFALGVIAACDTLAPATGAIRVEAATTGLDFDADGYRLRVDDGAPKPVEPNGSFVIAGLATGARALRLDGFALNCHMSSGTSQRTVIVEANDTVTVGFALQCSANVGAVIIAPITVGVDPDTNGYLVSVDGGPVREVGRAGGWLDSISVGNHTITISGVEGNCVPDQVTLPAMVNFNIATEVRHTLRCQERRGFIDFRTTTTGIDTDDSYNLSIESSNPRTVLANEHVTIIGIREGPHLAWLGDVSPNCTVLGSNPRTVNVPFGASTPLEFEITCEPAARLKVIAVTSGVDAPPRNHRFTVRTGPTLVGTGIVPANGSVTLTNVLPGNHTVTLDGPLPNCAVAPESQATQPVTTTAGNTSEVAFNVECVQASDIAFLRWDNGSRIYTGRTNGVSVGALNASTGDYDPAYSPDGSRIAFRSSRDGNHEIYVMNADGTGATRLTTNTVNDARPAWSPNGARIVFERLLENNNSDIYVMDADGSNVVRLTSDAAWDAHPSWSPDGTKIAFMSARSGLAQIWVMDADGSNPTRLTNSAAWEGLPVWSPDGSRIAFVREVPCDDYYYSCHNIFVMNANGSSIVQFATRSHDSEPSWSPDGKWILFSTRYCDYYTCYSESISAVQQDGTRRVEVVPGSLLNPVWRP